MSFLKAQWGPFPAWSWIGGAAVLVVAYLYFRNQGATSSTSTATSPSNYAVNPATAPTPTTQAHGLLSGPHGIFSQGPGNIIPSVPWSAKPL